jgi:hypothetical protein
MLAQSDSIKRWAMYINQGNNIGRTNFGKNIWTNFVRIDKLWHGTKKAKQNYY